MHACGYGRVGSIPVMPVIPGIHSPAGAGGPSSSWQSPYPALTSTGSGTSTRGRPDAAAARPWKRPRLARWTAAPYLPRRSLEAMAGGQGPPPRYGDRQSADVLLTLRPPDGRPPLPPLLLHSHALRRSEFFEARLSERWAAGEHSNPLQITLDTENCKESSTYVRCIQLLYVPDRVKHASFQDVQDALGILEVAAEFLFHDCVDACMRYLEAVPWTSEDENAIRASMANLQLQASPDLAARLRTTESSAVDTMEVVLGELLARVTSGAPSKVRDITERVLLANVQPSTSPAFAAVNEVALFKELHGNLEQVRVQLRKFANFFSWSSHQVAMSCSALRWLLDEVYALQIADVAVKMFSEEQELAHLMVLRVYQNPFTETLFHILVRMLQALEKGEIVSPRSVRMAIVSTWLPVVAKLGNDGEDRVSGRHNDLRIQLEHGLGAVVETLPILDQESIFKVWIAACLKCRKAWPDLSEAFDSWCSKLRAAQREDTDSEISSSRGLKPLFPAHVEF